MRIINRKSLALVAIVSLVGCSGGSQQQSQSQEQVNGNNANAQFENSNNASLNGNNKSKNGGEAINNAVEEGGNFQGANSGNGVIAENPAAINAAAQSNAAIPSNVPLNQSTPLNNGTGSLLGNNAGANAAANAQAAAPTDPASPTAPTTDAAPAAAPVSWDRMNASPFANPQMNWPGKGKVKYVTRKATRHAQPNGPVVGEYVTGDHPLVYQNGNWVELHDGTFVRGNSMTDKPVGYERP